ncbi:ABC transporter permease [Brevibacterium jeotgali]|uniref:Glycine betaine/proline transport system permease protein n=1 Tax=Brevibacterium jeotgali TaxID=1262550 RepID=A0A2H1L599_9MICO|nr:ABC transporter permease subunit [Brevibacterium jeotgali]TWB98468.1 glycine betaine/proline transport system permease protein [Brevibacterium jeotgali]SMY12081.1 glycine betaine/proline transport system permease protein [Brevibacterium jeotgali]
MSFLDFLYPRIPLGAWADAFITWFGEVFKWLIDGFTWLMQTSYEYLYLVLSFPQVLVDNETIAESSVLRAVLVIMMMLVFAGIAWAASNWKVAVFTFLGFYAIWALDQWENSMSTLALVIVAVIVALALALPLGVLASKSQVVSTIIKPILDFMQSMPALAYLVPAIVMFSVGIVPGAFATIIFAMPPGVRLTELAIRQVDGEKVEAGHAFGATPSHILFKIQMPLAMATIMAGINQVIMLALSMVVLAGMAGSGGLGGEVVGAISRLNVGIGVEAGLAVVIIAVFLDRMTAGLGQKTPLERAKRASA